MKIRRIYPMMARDGSEEYLSYKNYYLQEKYDGTRTLLFKDGKDIKMIGRSFKNDYSSRFPEIVNDAKRIKANQCILDGELTFFKNGKDIFITALAKPELKEGYDVKLMVFDVIEINGKSLKELPIEQRLKKLKVILPKLKHIEIVKTYKNPDEFKELFKKITSDPRQGEGVILKSVKSPYIEGDRNYWVKVKKEKTADCVVVGITYGTGWRSPYFGALILAQYDKDKLRFVGKTSGFDTNTLLQLYEKIKSMDDAKNPFGFHFPNVKKWVKPKIVVEVKYMERTPYGILRFPSFLRIRYDKMPNECIFK